ncbi:hypothetical protein BH09MYX1_BH09MYX1_29460 [soil metagenome]
MASPIPPTKKDDPEDVSWALTTAESQWARGDKVEALKWLRRAAESASEADADMRALELAKAAAELANSVSVPGPPPLPVARKSIPPAAPPRKTIPPAAPARKSSPPKAAAPAPAKASAKPAAGSPAMVAPANPAPAKVAAALVPKPVAAKPAVAPKEDPRKTARRSFAGEVQRGRNDDAEATSTSEMLFTGTSPAATDKLRDPMPTKPPEAGVGSANPDPDSWPTETLTGDELPVATFEQERTRIGAVPYRGGGTAEARVGPRPMQAVRVMLYRGADGTLRVAAAGSDVSAVSIEAMLVSLDPDVDLPSWLA